MVIQSFGKLIFEGNSYEMLRGIFNPSIYGFKSYSYYTCYYEILDKELYLKHLVIISDDKPNLHNVSAQSLISIRENSELDLDFDDTFYGYINVNLKLAFSGVVGVYNSFIPQEYPEYLFFEKGILLRTQKTKKPLSYFFRLKNLKSYF